MQTTLTKVEGVGDGALFIPLPPELLEKLAIREGDKLLLNAQPDGALLLRRADAWYARVWRILKTFV